MTSLTDEDFTEDLTADLPPQPHLLKPASVSRPAPAQPRSAPTAAPSPSQPSATPAAHSPKSFSVTAAKGATLAERYVLEEAIAQGGTAVIFRARDLRREGQDGVTPYVALKILRPEYFKNQNAIERLQREFRHAQSLTHPNIVRVLDCDVDRQRAGAEQIERWFITMELLEGDSLASLLKQTGADGLPPQRAVEVLKACAEALCFAHERGIVHGDFKPANIFVCRSGAVRVLDFGAATSNDAAQDHFPAATASYASPEVLSGHRPERRDDVFSFGCVAYEILNGKHPFERRSALEAHTRQMSPPRAWNLTDRQWFPLEAALAFRREERPADLRSLVNELLSSALMPPLMLPSATDLPLISVPPRDFHPRARGSRLTQNASLRPELEFDIDELPPREPLKETGNSFKTIAALIVLAVVAGIAYSRAQEHPERLATLRSTVSDWFSIKPRSAENVRSAPPLSEQQTPVATQVDVLKPTHHKPTKEAQPLPRSSSAVSPAVPNTNSSGARRTENRSSSERDSFVGTLAPRPAAPKNQAERPQREPIVQRRALPIAPLTTAAVPKTSDAGVERSGYKDVASNVFALTPPAMISFDTPSVTVGEGAGAAVLTLRRQQRLSGRASVHWRAVPGSAVPGQDYIAGAAGMTEFADGHTRRAIYVPLLTDAIAERTEEFTIELYEAGEGAQIWPVARATIKIHDDDRP